uniref:Uncharacterized protein n=1 Tax=Picea glauca TaxID=3330 RepID=A0A101LZR2_PICGL|nr:hypothetical protein ABT39_MTgene5205 [Picea glauca]QHR91184.1 hypothetical protein Q903MT_gene5216 [Picea sitchensis]
MSSDETQIFNTLLPLLNPAFTVPRSPHMGELYLQPIGYPTTLLLYSLHHSGVIPRGFPGERLGAPFPFEQFRTLPDLCLWKAVKISFEPAASSLPWISLDSNLHFLVYRKRSLHLPWDMEIPFSFSW